MRITACTEGPDDLSIQACSGAGAQVINALEDMQAKLQGVSPAYRQGEFTLVRKKYVHSATAKAKLPRTAMATFEVER